jgi:hypothetical protein
MSENVKTRIRGDVKTPRRSIRRSQTAATSKGRLHLLKTASSFCLGMRIDDLKMPPPHPYLLPRCGGRRTRSSDSNRSGGKGIFGRRGSNALPGGVLAGHSIEPTYIGCYKGESGTEFLNFEFLTFN